LKTVFFFEQISLANKQEENKTSQQQFTTIRIGEKVNREATEAEPNERRV